MSKSVSAIKALKFLTNILRLVFQRTEGILPWAKQEEGEEDKEKISPNLQGAHKT